MDEQEHKYLMTRRQCLIMELGAIEDRLGMERSIVPKRKRTQVEPIFVNDFVNCSGPMPNGTEIIVNK